MTIKELIERLEKIRDKEKRVLVSWETARCDFVWHEHVSDHPHALIVRT